MHANMEPFMWLMQAIVIAAGVVIVLAAIAVGYLMWRYVLPAIGRGADRLWAHLTRQG